jgi:hypothetical protein
MFTVHYVRYSIHIPKGIGIKKGAEIMNRWQKIAWFNLIIVSLALGLSVIAFCIGYFIFGAPANRAAAGFAFMGIMGFAGLTPVLFRKDTNKVQCDERDLAINRKAGMVAYAIFWVLFVAAAMVPWFIIGPNGMITVNYLPWMVFGGMCTVLLLQSIVTLNEYGWRGDGDK